MVNMGVFRCVVFLALCLMQAIVASGWINNWDQPLEFECPYIHQFISHVESMHHNHYEDRRYKMSCRKLPCHVTRCATRCHWTGYLNNFDDLLHFDCGRNGYVNGMRSVHNNHYEDRRWRVRCCHIKGLHLYDCRYTGWTNNWDQYQRFTTPSGRVTSGVLSVHKNHYEDRRWKFRTCKAHEHKALDTLVEKSGKRIQDESLESQNDY